MIVIGKIIIQSNKPLIRRKSRMKTLRKRLERMERSESMERLERRMVILVYLILIVMLTVVNLFKFRLKARKKRSMKLFSKKDVLNLDVNIKAH